MCTASENSTSVDIILGVSAETIHAVTIHKQKMMFQSPVALVKEIVWDHSEKSVHFVLDDGSTSPTFVFPVLTELEKNLSAIVGLSDFEKPPEQVYIGVLVGQNLPSPIQQRRAFLGSSQPTMLPMSTRRELLRKEQPVRNATSRERLGLEYMRSGYFCFTCSISGDLRGLTLEIHQLRIFPSPDCHDRSACLFSYGYEHLDSCEVEGTRLELRFRTTHQLAKQPSYLVFQSLEAQYIREAIWYLKNGTYMDASLREILASPRGSLRTSSIEALQQSSDIVALGRASLFLFFADADSLKERIDSCCRVIGCQNLVGCIDQSSSKPYEASASNVMVHINGGELSTMNRTSPSTTRVLTNGLCDFHASCLSSSESLTRYKSKPPLPAKSLQPLTSLLQSLHYAKMFKFQGQLQKRQNARTFLLRKAWHPKFVVLFETPVGGFLCYYDKITHCPGMTDTPKERRVIDLSSVLCIRPVSVASPLTASTPTMHAFDVVTLYRTWTFAALEPEEYEVWLYVLTESVEKHATMSPDKVQRFPVQLAMTGQTSPTEATSLEISSYGVSFCTGHVGGVVLSTWYYTDLEKWSVVYQQDYTCCLLRCRSPPPASPGSPRAGSDDMIIQDYLFRTTDASVICLAIEFYVAKCMAKLEILAGQLLEDNRQKSKITIDPVVSKRSPVNPKFELPAVKEHPIENVSLAPIGRSEDTMNTGDSRQQEVLVDLDATTKQQESESTITSATEEPLPIVPVEPKHQGANAEVLLTMEEPVQENCYGTHTSSEPVFAEWINVQQTVSSGTSTTTASDLPVEALTPVTSSEIGIKVVAEQPGTEASNTSEVVKSLQKTDLDERDTSNSEMESIDLLEGMQATDPHDGDDLGRASCLTPADVERVSQVHGSENSAGGLDDAALIEEEAKMLHTLEMSELSRQDGPSLSNDNPSSVLGLVDSENDVGIEVIDLQMENAPPMVINSVRAEEKMQMELSGANDTIRRSNLGGLELERTFISIQENDKTPNEDTTSFPDERNSENPLAISALETPPDLALECCLNECSEVSKYDETNCNNKRHRLLVELQANFYEIEKINKLVDALEGPRPDISTPDDTPVSDKDPLVKDASKGTIDGRDMKPLRELDYFPESSTATTIPAPPLLLLLLEHQSPWSGEETNEKLTRQPILQDDQDDRTSECEVSDTFNSCSSEVELVSQDTSPPPPQSTDATDDEFEDAIEHEELPSDFEVHLIASTTEEIDSDNQST